MHYRKTTRVIIGLGLLLTALAAASTSFAQDTTPPPPDATPAPACVPDAQTACARIIFYPATLKADLFLGAGDAAQPTAQVQQSTLWVTFASPAAGQTADVIVRNIHDGGAGEGDLYHYPDIAKNITVPFAAGQTSTVYLYPVKTYTRGKVAAKCAPQSVLAGEDVSCQVSIDGVVQTIPAAVPTTPPTPNADGSLPPAPGPTATLAAGQTATFILDPGAHELKIDLVGASASLWPPMTLSKTVTVTAGSYPQSVIATFAKAGHIVAKLAKSSEGWVGDFYLDGVLIAPQVGGIDQWVKGNSSHKVEAKNITQTGAPGIHPYYDGSSSTYAVSGQTSSLTVAMTIVPDSLLKSLADDNGNVVTVSTGDYTSYSLFWAASTAAIAEQNADHILMQVLLDGADVGPVRPYRRAATLSYSTSVCLLQDWTPCYAVFWKVPLGKLPAGAHTLTIPITFDTGIFNGWLSFNPGTLQLTQPVMVNAPTAP